MTKKKYSIRTLFKNAKNIGLIKGTAFPEFDSESKYHSVYNTKTSLQYGNSEIIMSLSHKIAQGIVESQDKNFNVFVCEQEPGKEFYLFCMGEGGTGQYNYFILDSSDDTYCATDMYSYLMFIGGASVVRYKYPGDEVDTLWGDLRFGDIIDTDQKSQFYTISDGLYYKFALEFLDGKDFDTECDDELFKQMVPFITKDITAFVRNDYEKIELSKSAKNLGVKAKGIQFVKPLVIEKPKTKEELIEELKDQTYEMFTAEEVKEMPALLREGYAVAKESYAANKEFFSWQEWMLISEIYERDVRSINFNGPAGVGKTTIIRSLAGGLGLPFVLVGGSEGIEESHLLGTREVVVEDGASKTVWVDGPITMAIRHGGFLLFDEVNAAEPGVLMKLNTILDGSKSLILPTGEEVKVHPNFIYADAMNVGAAYAGTNQMNMSHLDRIDQIFKIGPKPVGEEAKIIAANTGYTNMENLRRVCRIKEFILSYIDEQGDASEQICSPRRLITWVKKAKRTGEFIESSLNTVISHLSVYDPSITNLSKDEILNSGDNVASATLNKIIEEFDNISY